ncbi:MAG: sigma-70 family RNA polymerase sigma factor [Acutalibacteraceae bacterium]
MLNNRDVKVNDNLGLVHACAKRFRGKGIEYDDLFQAGCLGLVKAIDHFDESRGLCFSTYAVPVILGEIKRLFRDGGAVKVSRSLKELSLKAARESSRFTAENGREPTITELSEILQAEKETVVQALESAQTPMSLTVSDENGDTQIDIPTEAPDEKLTEIISLKNEVEKLPEKDRQIILMRFFQNKTQTQTAVALSMTQVQISRREKKILEYLRSRLK